MSWKSGSPGRILRAVRIVVLVSLAFVGAMPFALDAQTPVEFRGRVLDAGTRGPIAGAVVQVEGPESVSSLTDEDGYWRILTVPGTYIVRVRHLAYADVERSLEVGSTGTGSLELRMTPRALPIDAVVVTASRRLQRLADAPVATELITRREIEMTGTSDLSQVLVERLGVQLEGGVASGEGLMIQGMGSQRVLVLVDGQPLVGRVSGMLDVSRIPSSAVERIEVVKGPQSSLYGSDAIGGVVNIVTRGTEGPRWRGGAGLTAGTQGRTDGTLSIGGSAGNFGYLADLGRRETNLTPGRSATTGALAERWDALLKFDWQAAESVRLQASGMMVDDFQRWRMGDLFNFAEGRQWVGRVSGAIDFGGGLLSPTIHFSEFDRVYSYALGPEPGDSGEDEQQRLIEAELVYNGEVAGYAIDGGIEAKREQIRSDRIEGGRRATNTIEPFAQATFEIGGLQLVPGARLSLSNQWGTHLTPRLAAMYRPRPDLALRAGVGLGFRAPDAKELGMEFMNLGAGSGYVIRGNPDLKPERSTNLTLGLEWTRPTAYLRAQGFHNRFSDFIQNRLDDDTGDVAVYTYDNLARGYTRGTEVEFGATRGGFRFEGGYAWLQTRDDATGEPLLGRPAHSGRVTLEQRLPADIRGAVIANYTGEAPVQRLAGETLYRSGFMRVDLRLARSLPGGIEAAFGVRNLFDEEPERWPGYGRRHVYVGLDWRISADPS